MDSKLAEAAYGLYQGLPPSGVPGFFAARPEVPANASLQTRVLAFTGRKG